MATNTLEARITADISGLKKGLSEAEKLQSSYSKKIQETQKELSENIVITKRYETALEQLNKEYKSNSISQKEFQKQLSRIQRDEKETAIETGRLRKELTKLKRDSKDLGGLSNSMGKIKKSTANATPTVIEFSRVIQDAPYGIQGVANNIQQLTTNFTYLKKSAGGTIPALKALGSSFLGPAGVIFAVSTITSLLVSFGGELTKTKNKSKEFIDSLSGVSSSTITEFKILTNTLLDVTASKEQQTKAIEALRTKYKDFDSSILTNIKNYDKAKLAVQSYIDKLVEQARANAALSLIEEKQTKILVLQEKRNLRIREKFGVSEENLLEKKRQRALELNNKQLKDNEDLRKKREKQINDRFATVKLIGTQEINELEKQIQNLSKVAAIRDQVLFGGSGKDGGKKDKRSTASTLDINITPKITSDPKDIAKSTRSYVDSVTGEIKQVASDISKEDLSILSPFSDLKLELPAPDTTAFSESLRRALETGKMFTSALGSSFNALAGQISGVLATGNAVVDAFVSSMVSSLANLLSQFIANQVAMSILGKAQIAGEQAKANAAGIVIATQAATAFGPLGPAALPGLIAGTAAMINGSFAPLYAFANGGIVPGGNFNGDRVPAFVNSGEMILNTGQQANLFKALDGNLGSLQGNGGSGGFVAETVLRGDDMYVLMKRAEKKYNRFNK